jgi:HD-like signal output (HDOD) protein
MTGIMSFLKELFGLGFMAPEKSPSPKKIKVLTNHKLALESSLLIDENPWWETPLYQDESAEFEEIANTVLYDELQISLKESRLEVIEIPATIAAVMGIIHRKHFWYSDVIKTIERSPALTGDFLSIVNSAAFSRGLFIYGLDNALPRLGRTQIQSILFLNASKMSLPETPLFNNIVTDIISESQAVAKMCRILSPVFGINTDEAFLAGLLHNIGKIGLLKQISKHYNLPDDLDMEYHQSLFKNILPVFANDAGKIIGEYWKLEPKIIRVLSHHNKLTELERSGLRGPELRLVALVNLCIYMCRILGFGEVLRESNLFGQHSCKILGFRDTPVNRNILMRLYHSFSEQELPKIGKVA